MATTVTRLATEQATRAPFIPVYCATFGIKFPMRKALDLT